MRSHSGIIAAAETSSLLIGLVAYYKLDEASGARADSSPNALNLTSNNAVGSAAGILNDCAVFVHTSSQSLSRATTSPLQTFGAGWSVSFWLNINSTSSGYSLFGNVNGNSNVGISQSGSGNATDGIDVTVDGFATGYIAGGAYFTPGTWAHVVVVYDPTVVGVGRLRVYVNGVSRITINSGQPAPASIASGANDFKIGDGPQGVRFFDGKMDEIGLWNRALTATEASLLYGDGTPPAYPYTLFNNSTILVYDTFHDADGTALTSHAIAPTNTGAIAWTNLTATEGHIQGNALLQDVGGIATLDSGQGDVTITYFGNFGSLGAEPCHEILFRIQDQNNYLWLHVKYVGEFSLLQRIAGAYTNVVTVAWTPDNNDHALVLKVRGNRIRGYLDGVKMWDVTTSQFAGQTKYGLAQGGTGLAGSGALNAVCKSLEVRVGEQFPSYP